MAERVDVMISSTARDLPAHRKEAMDACLRQGMFPIMMEQLPASDSDAITESLNMVDEAEIYMGIFAYRYGYIPKGHDISVTEMEYNRAVERKIPRLIFVMDKTHPITPEQMGEGLDDDEEELRRKRKLNTFKNRVQTENIVNFFDSPADLRAKIIDSLSKTDLRQQRRDITNLHSPLSSDIPLAPKPYIAHPYTLLQTTQLAGRQAELNLLTDWVAKSTAPIYQARILNIVAIGGMGKSALTWKWFNDVAPLEMKSLAGRMWWSFYESDARFENFVTRALAYVSRRPREEIEKLPAPEREEKLLNILDTEPFLLVLDGLERILIAYARMDAAYLRDDDLDEEAANYVTGALGLPESAAQSFVGQHRLRKTADPRAGHFLRRLAAVRASRILVSTRLYPAELQTVTGGSIPNSAAIFLKGLKDDDALDLWRAMGVSGSRDALLPLFHRFENYPLLIRALAGVVANYKRAPGDFDVWRKNNPDFNPLTLPLANVKSHVLSFALADLDDKAKKVLHTVAAFRMAASYDTLAGVLIGEGKPFPTETALDAALVELEDRGLIGWDKSANRYDLHPIVRGVTWDGLDGDGKRGVYQNLHAHFEAVPNRFSDWQQVNSLEDLAPAIELYNTLIGLGRYEDAYVVFRDRLSYATLYRLSANRQRVELLEMLLPDGLDQLPRLNDPSYQAVTLNSLALAYQYSGHPGRAVPLFRQAVSSIDQLGYQESVGTGLRNLSDALRLTGGLREAEAAARRALVITRERENRFGEAITLQYLGLIYGLDKQIGKSKLAFYRTINIAIGEKNSQLECTATSFLAQSILLYGDAAARPLADRAWELAHSMRLERDFIQSAQLQGSAALGLGDLAIADERLHHALTRARAVNLVEEELPALVGLAELHRQRGEIAQARERLDEIWESAERGPYPLFHADALNVLAQIEIDAGNRDKAVEAADKAYRLVWCDGISADGKTCYAYWWGLKRARKHLESLGEPIPDDLPPFDESQFDPLPEVEINPKDEFWVDESKLDI